MNEPLIRLDTISWIGTWKNNTLTAITLYTSLRPDLRYTTGVDYTPNLATYPDLTLSDTIIGSEDYPITLTVSTTVQDGVPGAISTMTSSGDPAWTTLPSAVQAELLDIVLPMIKSLLISKYYNNNHSHSSR